MRIRTVLPLLTSLGVLTPLSAHAFLDVLLGQGAAQMAQGAASQNAMQQAAQVVQSQCADKQTAACAQAAKLAQTRPSDQLDKLFTGEPVSGDAFMAEIRTIRSSLGQQNLNLAMSSLLGSSAMASGQAASASGGFFSGGGFFSSITGAATDALLDMLVAELSYQALDTFFSTMADSPGLLKEVQVTLPKLNALMTPDMKQQLTTMGGFLVAIKASGKIIDASEKDFETAKDSYRKVLDSRVAAAKLLGDAFYARSGLFAAQQESNKRGEQLLTAADQAYLESMRDKTPEDFMRDFNAQNIALNYLRKSSPKEYDQYRSNIDEFKTSYGAYTKTAIGATSMIGFSSVFLKKAKNMLEKNGLVSAPALLPMVGDGLSEVISLAPRIKKTIELSPDTQDGTFILKLSSGEQKANLGAGKVFSQLPPDTRQSFQNDLFKNGQAGYFGQLGEKYPSAAGSALDDIVEKETRKLFVKNYLQESDLPDFSFQNVITGNARKSREVKAALFRSAPNESVEAEDEKAVAAVQKDVRDKVEKWDNSTLRRIIFANRDTSKSNIELAINGAVIGIDSPGMKGIMEYEEMANQGVQHAATLRKAESSSSASPAPNSPKGKKSSGKNKGSKLE